ncbi:MAG: histidine kinase, partial [Bacteroidota bacterium]|nr:histidine kinase [Bacteroidota bacterium]
METQPDLSSFLVLGSIFVLLLCLTAIIYLIFKLNNSAKENQVLEFKYQEMESKYNQIELENLDSRLNPHLFKNILNSVQSHAYQTYFALDKLSNVLDY